MQCAPKPEGDKYGFTHFARASNSGRGLTPLPSDSRRRPDRKALEVSHRHPILVYTRERERERERESFACA